MTTTVKTLKKAITSDIKNAARNAKVMRLENDLGITAFANAVKLSTHTIRRIEQVTSNASAGAYNPTYRTIAKLAKTAGVSVETFTTMHLNYQ